MTSDKKTLIKLYLLFIPLAYFSYLFHEFGHWIVGELLGNEMAYSLNHVWPRSGDYIASWNDLYVSMGGPGFTILLALIFLLVIEKYGTIYAYPIVIFQFSLRFFSLTFGGFSKQDEARIALILNIWTYSVGIIVLVILFLILLRASLKLRISIKQNGYFLTASILSQILVIATDKLMGY